MFVSFIRTLILYVIIVAILRIMGKRQVGELEPADLVVAILISDLAAVPMQDIGIPLLSGVIPIVTLLALELLTSEFSMRNIKFRAFLCGKPEFIIRNGIIDQKAMAKTRLTIDELNFCLRQKGIMEFSQVQYAILEPNGQLSTFLYPEYAPVTAGDNGTVPDAPDFPVILISDGRLLSDNLSILDQDEIWLDHVLLSENVSLSEVYLMTATAGGNTYIVKKERLS